MVEGRLKMPFRMAEYSCALLRSFADALERGLLPASVILYLDRKCYVEDPGRFQILGAFNYQFSVDYAVVKLWEISPEPILEMESPGLLPLVPLMAGNPRELVVRSAERIRDAQALALSDSDCHFLFQALGIFARRVLVKSEIEELLSDPEFYKLTLGYEAGMRQGQAEGQALADRQSIRRILESRFGVLPADLLARVDALKDLAQLESLVVTAARSVDLDAFRAALGSDH